MHRAVKSRAYHLGDAARIVAVLGASDFHLAGPARVIAGEYGGVKSVVESPRDITYLDVRLKAGERWAFHPTEGHHVAWIASHQGIVTTPEQVSMGEVAVFEKGDQAIEFLSTLSRGCVAASAPLKSAACQFKGEQSCSDSAR